MFYFGCEENTLLFDNYHEVSYAEPNLETFLCSQKIDDLNWIKLQNPNDISVMHLVVSVDQYSLMSPHRLFQSKNTFFSL